jgi:predicted SAM-dependent methyltransferase
VTAQTPIERLGDLLQRVPGAHSLAARARTEIWLARRNGQIKRYMRSHEPRCLRLGAGRHLDSDWLSFDLFPTHWHTVLMDARRPFPFPNESVDVIQCEHMIEHISYEDGLRMLSECHRILRKDGLIRIATPDLELVGRLIGPGAADGELADYVRSSNMSFGTPSEKREPHNAAFAANRLMSHWGHLFIYDATTLRRALEAAGFGQIARMAPGESSHAVLRGVDRHHEEVGPMEDRIETLTLEATA